MRRIRKLLIFSVIIVIIACYFIIRPAFRYLSGYLAESQPVNANLLIVEGWIPDYALNEALHEIRKKSYQYVVTTGLKYSDRYFNLSEDGYLIFYTGTKKPLSDNAGRHLIEVEAAGSLSGDFSAHFNLFVNDSLIADYFADKHKRKYQAYWSGSLSSVDSLMVQFTNDFKDRKHDINLYVKDIIIDKKITIPYLYNSDYDMSKLDGIKRITNNYSSLAELARNRLLSKGIDSSLVIAIPGERTTINRTLKSALAFRNWLRCSNLNIKGINIVSMGTHARRTWMIYRKILNEKYDIGIISVPDLNFNHSRTTRLFRTIRETLGIIYYWFVLIPY
jgi:hypothetical protein